MIPTASPAPAPAYRSSLGPWFATPPHDEGRSLALVRVGTAILLAAHPLHAFVHPEHASALRAFVDGHGWPRAAWLVPASLALLLAAAVALLVPRSRTAHAAGAALGLLVVVGGLPLFAGHWFVVGGLAEDGQPGVEYSVLLASCLAGVLWGEWPGRTTPGARASAARRGFDVVRVMSAFALLAHGYGPFVLRDVAGMHEWGDAMTASGWPFGVGLVWGIKALECLSSLLRLARRFVVPACLGHLSYIVPGMWISHRLHWFVLGGGGEGGIEFSVLLSVCAVATMLAYWPRAALDNHRARSSSTTSSGGAGDVEPAIDAAPARASGTASTPSRS